MKESGMDFLDTWAARLREAFPQNAVVLEPNPAVPGQGSLLVERPFLLEVARWLRDRPEGGFDYCSNVTGVDWPGRTEKVRVKRVVDGVEREEEGTREVPGTLEVVYHLYSMRMRMGPLILRVRTGDRATDNRVPSLTPVWRSCELQEREVYDLFGVCFEGHPDLRRLLMWDGFQDHPMRKDYVEPDDYEYEPTPHDHVLERVNARSSARKEGA